MVRFFFIVLFLVSSQHKTFADGSTSKTIDLNQSTCSKEKCTKTEVPESIVVDISAALGLTTLEQMNPKTGPTCPIQSKGVLPENQSYSACSTDSKQYSGLQPFAVTFPIGDTQAPEVLMAPLRKVYTAKELEKLKGRIATAFIFAPTKELKLATPLKSGSSATSIHYGNDRFPFVSDKVSYYIDSIKKPTDQGKTASIGLSHEFVLGENTLVSARLNSVLRTMRYGSKFTNEDGQTSMKQFAQEEQSLNLSYLRFSDRLKKTRVGSGLGFSIIRIDGSKNSLLKKGQIITHDKAGKLMPENTDASYLSEKRLEVAGLFAVERFFHPLNGNCLFKIGANASIGFVGSNKGGFTPKHSLTFSSSISKYFPALKTEGLIGLDFGFLYHNLSNDNFREPNSSDIIGLQFQGAAKVGLRWGNATLFLTAAHEGDKGLNEGILYYGAQGKLLWGAPNRKKLILNLEDSQLIRYIK